MSIAQCGNCGATFAKPKTITKMVYGVEIIDKVCPECLSPGYTKMTAKMLRFFSKYDDANLRKEDRK